MEDWRRDRGAFWAFTAPAALWLVAFFLVPLAIIWLLSFSERVGLAERVGLSDS